MLNEKLKNYNLILASGSPRRQKFLKDLNLNFSIKLKEIEEIYPEHLVGTEITDFLAELKANAFKNELSDNDLLVTADTIVLLNEKVLGKPKDKTEAVKMLTELSGKSHQVASSISLTTTSKQKTFSDLTTVYFKELSQNEIEFYIENYQPFDKAGAYGIQEWLGFIAIEKLEGSYYNVMGFPVHKFYKEILNF